MHFKNFVITGSIVSVFSLVWGAEKPTSDFLREGFDAPSILSPDSDSLHYPWRDRIADKYNSEQHNSPMYLQDPVNIKDSVEYDPVENQYNINENMGRLFYRNPSYMTFEEFRDHEFNKSTGDYWRQRASEEDDLHKKSFAPKITINSVVFDRIFGGNTIDIRPQGSAELTFSALTNSNQNPALPERQRTVTTFNFNEDIQMNVTANIGTKMKLAMNYNTKATFEFENKMKLEYTGGEDDIIKKIEAGNVSLPLTGQLIQGSQSLFGIKTQLQFGKLTATTIFSQQKGKQSCIDVQSGSQQTKFDVKGDQYEANRHFFLAQYFKDHYEPALNDINQIRSGINITRIEVWVTNRNSTVAAATYRNIIGFSDLGEKSYDASQSLIQNAYSDAPSDSANDLYTQLDTSQLRQMRASYGYASSRLGLYAGLGFTQGKNYEILQNAKLLQKSEYSVNELLGYISLNTELQPGQILAVAYEYTLNGKVYHVGELSTSGVTAPDALYLKLIRSTSFNPGFYTWDLMMKNVYNIGAYSLDSVNFRLDVLYQDDKIGGPINFIPEGGSRIANIPLVKVLGLDKLNTNGDPQPDGMFDFKDQVTVNKQNGRIYFPVLEPFGKWLFEKFDQAIIANKYVYQQLYDTTRTAAQQVAERNKFSLRGAYKSSSSSGEIPLNAVNIPAGSVTVTAGGAALRENTDYTVDYTIGRVKIINDAYLRSNAPIKICFESNSLFNIQTKTLIGGRFDYVLNKDVTFGATIMHLSERPLTQKVNIGDEPISNTMIGLDGTYRTDSRFITKMLDKLPLYNTKEISTVTVSGEVADLIPGHSNAVGSAGTSYIDDFEGAITPIDIKNSLSWYLSSTPLGQTDLFPEGGLDSLGNGFNRARTAWYYVDPLFQHDGSTTPSDIDVNEESNNYVREIPQAEIFPAKSSPYGPQSITCTNLAFYPTERGQYNYDVTPTAYSAGLDTNGTLKSPEERWGGVMRKLETNDFQSSNIEFIQFWMLDPFGKDSPNDDGTGNYSGGDLYFNLGDISEDVLKDGNKCYENGLPTSTNPTTGKPTVWGQYPDPNLPQVGYQFPSEAADRKLQDVGLDGLGDGDERNFFAVPYLSKIAASFGTGSQAYINAGNDPSADDYSYYQSDIYNSASLSPLDRYKNYNGLEGNSPSSELIHGYQSIGTNTPDAEDLNKDFTLENFENYYQYHVNLRPSNMVVGSNFITDIVETTANNLPNQTTYPVKWYQFKIPIQQPERVVGSPNISFIQSIRMFLKGFTKPVICRFAKLELLRGDWRKYNASLLTPGEYSPTPEYPGNAKFDVSYVSIEENSGRYPIPYVLPPGIDKERDISTTQLATLNEQSLSMEVCGLEDGDSRAAYKNTQLDLRSYKRLKMFVHAESIPGETVLQNGQMTAFIRLGSDYVDNYYEYEIPLTVSPQSSGLTAEQIWPTANDIDIDLNQLVKLKLQRDNEYIAGHRSYQIAATYTVTNASGVAVRISIKGSPSLSNIRSVMIGMRNSKDAIGTGVTLCGEMWVNELRLSDFDERGGWAATARVQAKLADLGNMTLVGNHSTSGWGSIEKKVSERDKVDRTSYDFSTSLELGKFIPEKTGIKIPFFFEYAEDFNTPQYNPLDPDVILKDNLDAAATNEIRDSIKNITTEYKQRKSINFTNVKKTKTGKNPKSRVYDVENLSFTYAYTETYSRDYNIAYDMLQTYNGIIGYNFNNAPKAIQPFTKAKALSSPYLKLVKDFNFYLAPTSLSFRTSLDRMYHETQLRNNTGGDYAFTIEPTYAKSFIWRRDYGLNFDLTKSVKLDFSARADASIDEPPGRVDTKEAKDSVRTNLMSFGRLKNYHQATNITYNVPLSKLPLTDWMTLSARYSADFNWKTGSLAYDTYHEDYRVNSYKNEIQNSQTKSLNGSATFTSLYNKVPYLKKINQPEQSKPKADNKPKQLKLPKDSTQKAQADTLKKKPNPLAPVIKELARFAMSLKTASFTYSETNGIWLPGFDPRPKILGQNFNYQNTDSGYASGPVSTAPGWGFVFGDQRDIRPDAVRYQWLSHDTSLNNSYITSQLKNFTASATIEPIKNFKIVLSANRNFSLEHREYFRIDNTGDYHTFSPTETGNFSMSYFTWNTAFIKDNANYSNATFQKFSDYRSHFSQLLGRQNPFSTGADPSPGFRSGYGSTQQEVLTASFLAAYGDKSPTSSSINKFPKIPLPNWKITYDGLGKLKALQKIFSTISLSHGYRSTYSVNSFNQNLLYAQSNDSPIARDTIGNFIPNYDFQQVTIAEQMAPLFGLDMTWKNSLQTRFEIKRDRTLTLSYANIQVTEVRGTEYTFGIGYKIKKFTLPFRIGSTKKKLSSPLNLRGDFNIRNNTTIIRKLVENTNQPSAGTETVSFKVSADYAINERFNVNAFFEKQITNPFVSTSYPNSRTEAGIKLRFTLTP